VQSKRFQKLLALATTALIGGLQATVSAPAAGLETPTLEVLVVEPISIGAKMIVQVTNKNAFPLGFLTVDCVGALPEKKLIYGPAEGYVGTVPVDGKATAVVTLQLQNMSEIFAADKEIAANVPVPADTKCQVREFEMTYKYAVPALTAPAQ